MTFFSASFVILLAAALVLYYLFPRQYRWLVLLLASAAFYLWSDVTVAGYLLFTILTSYVSGRLLGRLAQQRKSLPADQAKAGTARIKRKKRAVVAVDLVLCFGLLFAVKYWSSVAQGVSGATNGLVSLPVFDLVMPLGLSFYIFQSAGYVIDCYREKHAPETNVLKFALFVSFFPQLVQGPISRFHELEPQLIEPHDFDADQLKYGIQRVLWGYLKKLVLADRAAVVVNAILGDLGSYGGAMYAFAILFYCVQLYCDFSGGIDITIGVAEMFGVTLTENFRQPFFATSLADYWRRWHITLGSWMRDYLFYPLSLSKPLNRVGRFARKHIKGKLGKIVQTAMATFVVYLVIGIWHGANLRYVFFGLWNGTLITASLLLAEPYRKVKTRLHIQEERRWYHWFQMGRTMFLVFLGRYITCAPRLLTALHMLKRTFFSPAVYQLTDGSIWDLGLAKFDYAVVALGMLVLLLVEWRQEQGVDIRKRLEEKSPVVQWLCILIPLAVLFFLGIFRDSAIQAEFIYQQY
jgi:D-alanyl-lipoteichoic acid acyltransferase DltB (MBOAT superfamily)